MNLVLLEHENEIIYLVEDSLKMEYPDLEWLGFDEDDKCFRFTSKEWGNDIDSLDKFLLMDICDEYQIPCVIRSDDKIKGYDLNESGEWYYKEEN